MRVNISQYIQGEKQYLGKVVLDFDGENESLEYLKSIKNVMSSASDDIDLLLDNDEGKTYKAIHTRKSFGPLIFELVQI